MMDTLAAVQWVDRNINLRRRHSVKCRVKSKLKTEWQQSDKCKTCTYWSVGIHAPGEKFARRSTGATSLKAAQEILVAQLTAGSKEATPDDSVGISISKAIAEYETYIADGGATRSTLKKYKILMDQLQAFCDWKRIRFIGELDQDAVLQFRREWENERAGYKVGHERNGKPRWRKMSIATCKRSAKTLRYLFSFAILRKWMTENPTAVLRFPKVATSKTKEEVKFLTQDQMTDLLWAAGKFEKMTAGNQHRLRALMLLMRWSGLRLSDAVIVTKDMIVGDVLMMETKKASTKVQIPLPKEVTDALAIMTPYAGGYYFWNRQTEGTDPATPIGNFTTDLRKVFDKAGVKRDHRLSHRFRNSFAVDLLTRGAPMETVSLLLGHRSVQTTERYYADFTAGYMDRAEDLVRKTWDLKEGERLDWTVKKR